MCPSATAGTLTGEEVVRYLVTQMAAQNKELQPKFSPTEELDKLAAADGLASYKELGIFIRAETWVTFCAGCARTAGARAEKIARKEHKKLLKEAQEAHDETCAASQILLSRLAPSTNSLVAMTSSGDWQAHVLQQLLKWASAPVSAGTTLSLPGLNSAERKQVHRLVEMEEALSSLKSSSHNQGDERVLVISRTAPEYNEDVAVSGTSVAPVDDGRIDVTEAEALAQLHGMLSDVSYVDSAIARLAAAEQRLLDHFGATMFEDLQLAESSFAAFCNAHSNDLEPLLHTTEGDGRYMSLPESILHQLSS